MCFQRKKRLHHHSPKALRCCTIHPQEPSFPLFRHCHYLQSQSSLCLQSTIMRACPYMIKVVSIIREHSHAVLTNIKPIIPSVISHVAYTAGLSKVGFLRNYWSIISPEIERCSVHICVINNAAGSAITAENTFIHTVSVNISALNVIHYFYPSTSTLWRHGHVLHMCIFRSIPLPNLNIFITALRNNLSHAISIHISSSSQVKAIVVTKNFCACEFSASYAICLKNIGSRICAIAACHQNLIFSVSVKVSNIPD